MRSESGKVEEVGIILPCMDRRHRMDSITDDVRRLMDFDPDRQYLFLLGSPGGNIPLYLARALETLALNAEEDDSFFNVTDIFFIEHTQCAAKRVKLHVPPHEGARLLIQLYRQKQKKYRARLTNPRPNLHIARIETRYSHVEKLLPIRATLWDEVPPLVVDMDFVLQVFDLLMIDYDPKLAENFHKLQELIRSSSGENDKLGALVGPSIDLMPVALPGNGVAHQG